jgi:hypothetical protein
LAPGRVYKGSTLSCNTDENPTVVFQFQNGEIMTLTKTPMEKTSNGMKLIGRQLLLWLIIAGTVYRSQGTIQRAVIDYRMKFREHMQLYAALSGVKSSGSLCVVLPDDMDNFTIRPVVNVDVVQMFETMRLPDGYQFHNFAR